MAVGILALLDDVSLLLDDAAAMTKISMQKTAGLLGDDLAVNAQKASGFSSTREIPIIKKIAIGAFKNKLIILPIAFILSATFPTIISFFLILGGCYLAFEGTEKIHEFFHQKVTGKKHTTAEINLSEEEKIKSAIFTDFILSIEIIVITLSTVFDKSLSIQIAVVSTIALIATVAVYGLVALIVRLDDLGLYLISKSKSESFITKVGKGLISSLPYIIKILGFIGTWAMLVVAGGIFSHNISFFHQIKEYFSNIPVFVFDTLLGFVIGYILVVLFFVGNKIYKSYKLKPAQ